MVFVLDKHKKPLMPCTPKKARLLLSRGRAVVHRLYPLVIRLKDRRLEESVVQPLVLKIDPGSKTSGMAVARVEATPQGEVHHAVHLAEIGHRGQQVHAAMGTRARARRRRRSAHLRSRIGNVPTWAQRYRRWSPLTRLEVEQVKFDLHLIQNPELAGIEYQRGELAGWELRAYLLAKFQHRCAYCHKGDVPFEIDHQVPRSRGGSNRASNLVLSCHGCNVAKGTQTAAEFGHPDVEAQAKSPLKDAAAVNATRYALVRALGALNLPIGTWSGGRTRWNRDRFGLPKTHALDALCVGEFAGIHARTLCTLRISASGRGQYCRTLFTKHGFPRGYLMRQKQVNGVQTGDLVLAVVPPPYQAQGTHKGRVAVRKSGFFRINGVDSIPACYCTVLQRGDGYDYAFV